MISDIEIESHWDCILIPCSFYVGYIIRFQHYTVLVYPINQSLLQGEHLFAGLGVGALSCRHSLSLGHLANSTEMTDVWYTVAYWLH